MTEGTTYQLITDVCEYSADSTIFQIFFAKNEVLISSAGEPSASTGAQRIQLFDVPICMINRVSAFTRGEARRSEAAQRLLPFQTYLRIFYYRKRRLACAKISSIRRARDQTSRGNGRQEKPVDGSLGISPGKNGSQSFRKYSQKISRRLFRFLSAAIRRTGVLAETIVAPDATRLRAGYDYYRPRDRQEFFLFIFSRLSRSLALAGGYF